MPTSNTMGRTVQVSSMRRVGMLSGFRLAGCPRRYLKRKTTMGTKMRIMKRALSPTMNQKKRSTLAESVEAEGGRRGSFIAEQARTRAWEFVEQTAERAWGLVWCRQEKGFQPNRARLQRRRRARHS